MNHAPPKEDREAWPRFRDIPEPRMVGFFTGNGSGSKLFQGFIDGHPEVYMIPGYMLMYLYPHWEQWRNSLPGEWAWPNIIDAFCRNHASILDTRRIPGFDGLTKLGESRSEYIYIDETTFRNYLLHLLDGEPVKSKTFLLAVHYAYAKCLGQKTEGMKCVFFHIHVHKYVVDYLAPDFPDMKIIAMVRDPRSNLRGRFWSSAVAVDKSRLNVTDAAVYLPLTYNYVIWEQLNGLDVLDVLDVLDAQEIRVVRHEDLYYAPRNVLRATAEFMGVSDSPCFETVTFGGKFWWGDMIYGAQPINAANPSIVSDRWKEKTSTVDWYVFEGIFFNYLKKYDYEAFKYTTDGFLDRVILFGAILLPSRIEMQIWIGMVKPSSISAYLKATWLEATGQVPLKDYSSNAYYRHKWTNKSLKLWKPRRFRVRVMRAYEQNRTDAGSGVARVVAGGEYIAVSIFRYIYAVLSLPLLWIKRNMLFIDAYIRRLRHHNLLPRALR